MKTERQPQPWVNEFVGEIGGIKQVLPADGWYAQYRADDGPILSKLVCWALVLTGTDVDITGYDTAGDGIIDACVNKSNFEKFIHESEIGNGQVQS